MGIDKTEKWCYTISETAKKGPFLRIMDPQKAFY